MKTFLYLLIAFFSISCSINVDNPEQKTADEEVNPEAQIFEGEALAEDVGILTPIDVPVEGVYEYAVVKGQVPNGQAGGKSNPKNYVKRVLTKLETAGGNSWISMDNNEISLEAGSYFVKAYALNYAIRYNRLVLHNMSNNSPQIIGMSNYTRGDNSHGYVQNMAYLSGIFEINANTDFELRHYAETYHADGKHALGLPTSPNSGESFDELYTLVEIVRLNE